MDKNGLLIGAGIGAAVAFVIDPDRGTRRRALIRDKTVRAARLTRNAVHATACDMSNRGRGVIAATRGRFRREQLDDVTLSERVRARLGRVSSHPHAIELETSDGEVTLHG